MNPLFEKLLAGGPVITDGACGTQLQARGLPPGGFPDVWNLRHPDQVLQVARQYVLAGSEIILTNTFGSNRFRLHEIGMDHEVREINAAGVWIAREAAQGESLVFGSIGPSGKMLITGDTDLRLLQGAFEAQAQALAEAGVDGIVIETMSELGEARVAIAAAKATELPVVACMVFDCGKAKDRTMMGDTPETAACVLAEAGADAIGANCGQGIATAVDICRRFSAATSLPVWIKPNAGLPEIENGKIRYRTSPEEFASYLPALVQAGAHLIGGCCGTNPDFIRKLRALRDGLPRREKTCA